MEHLRIEHITTFVEAHRYLGYALLYGAMVIEGEIFLIIAGVLAHLHALDIGDAFLVALFGVITGDCLWYYAGVTLKAKRFARHMVLRAEKTVTSLLPNFNKKPFISIFFSKFIYGANHATLIVSGAVGVHFRTFVRSELVASSTWTVFFLSVGYFFGFAAIQFTRRATHFILLTALFVVGFVLLQRAIAFYYEKRKFSELEKGRNA